MTALRNPRPNANRKPALKRVVAGSFSDTEPLIEALLKESGFAIGWKPGRAAALRALADPGRSHVWMTTAEFKAWVARNKPRGSGDLLEREFGIGRTRRHSIEAGAHISKIEALALAHYAAGLPLPIPADDTKAFVAWFTPRFGASAAVSRALGVSGDYVNDRLQGFDIGKHGRIKRLPEAILIRALDWVWRVGPLSPYGERNPAPLFPGQELLP